MTTIYFIRHSKVEKVNNILNQEELQIQNEKQILSIEGEKLAEDKLNIDELKNIDVLYSSNYVRAISTAKYISNYNNIGINIIDNFGERKFGVTSYSEIPEDFYMRQAIDETYKVGTGESQCEVRERMLKGLDYVLENNLNKRVAIVTHSTALLFLLKTWCEFNIEEKSILYKGKIIIDGNIDNCCILKLAFENKELINIEKV